jgi:hypothetical protein
MGNGVAQARFRKIDPILREFGRGEAVFERVEHCIGILLQTPRRKSTGMFSD